MNKPTIRTSVMLEWIFQVYARRHSEMGNIHLNSEEVAGEHMFLLISHGSEQVRVDLMRHDGVAVRISASSVGEMHDELNSEWFASGDELAAAAKEPLVSDTFLLTEDGACLSARMNCQNPLLERVSFELLILRSSFLTAATALQAEWQGDERTFNLELSRLKHH